MNIPFDPEELEETKAEEVEQEEALIDNANDNPEELEEN